MASFYLSLVFLKFFYLIDQSAENTRKLFTKLQFNNIPLIIDSFSDNFKVDLMYVL
jgi:hypothetical protein